MGVNPSGEIVLYAEGERLAFGLVDKKDGVHLLALGLPRIRPVLERLGPRFGARRVGVYGFRFRTLDQVDVELIERLVREIAKLPNAKASKKRG